MDMFQLTTKRIVIGHLTICQGCCCGNIENGRPPVPVDWLKSEWRARGLLKRVQLTISGCLGPCDLPNVITISNEAGTQWFGGITDFNQYRALVDWASRSKEAGKLLPLPSDFKEHTLHPFRKHDSGTGLLLGFGG
jgi:cobaltochelatase CobN